MQINFAYFLHLLYIVEAVTLNGTMQQCIDRNKNNSIRYSQNTSNTAQDDDDDGKVSLAINSTKYGNYMARQEAIVGHKPKTLMAGVVLTKEYILAVATSQFQRVHAKLYQKRIVAGINRQIVGSGESFCYEGYSSPLKSPDIGIVRLQKRLKLQPNVLEPIPLPTRPFDYNGECVAVTWGRNMTRDILFEYKVRTINKTSCSSFFPTLFMGAICFEMMGYDDPCSLLPGSPIICEDELASIVALDPSCNIYFKRSHNIRISTGVYFAKNWMKMTVHNIGEDNIAIRSGSKPNRVKTSLYAITFLSVYIITFEI